MIDFFDIITSTNPFENFMKKLYISKFFKKCSWKATYDDPQKHDSVRQIQSWRSNERRTLGKPANEREGNFEEYLSKDILKYLNDKVLVKKIKSNTAHEKLWSVLKTFTKFFFQLVRQSL